MEQERTVRVLMRQNFRNIEDDALSQIDKGGIFYVNCNEKIFMKTDPEAFLDNSLHAHDYSGNKYLYCGTSDDFRTLYKECKLLINDKVAEARRYLVMWLSPARA